MVHLSFESWLDAAPRRSPFPLPLNVLLYSFELRLLISFFYISFFSRSYPFFPFWVAFFSLEITPPLPSFFMNLLFSPSSSSFSPPFHHSSDYMYI